MPVRAFAEDDIPKVADLYWTVLRKHKGPSPVEVRSRMHELYFENPWIDSSLPSLVVDEKGSIAGFLGVVPRRMSLGGQSFLTALGGNFVVHPDFRNSLAGLHLLRAYMSGGQDLSLTDSANDVSRTLLERLGFTTIMPFSVHWVRLLRPSRFASFAMSRLAGNAIATSLEFVARPFCAAMDRLAGGLTFSPLCQIKSPLRARELDVETLLCCQKEFRNGYSLWTEYDVHSLSWLLSFMARMKGHGDKLQAVLLCDQTLKTVGWYIYSSAPGRIGEVVQIGGERRRIKDILYRLFHDAWSHGVIALHGIVDRQLMAEFSEMNCFFTCRGGWMVAHSRKSTFLEPLNRGDAFLSRLDGEWCLAFGD